MHESAFIKGTVIGAVVCHLAELGIYIAILIKQTKIETNASSVYIAKDNQRILNRESYVKHGEISSKTVICLYLVHMDTV